HCVEPRHLRPVAPGLLAADGLDLDDVRAEPSQELRARRACLELRQVQDANARQRALGHGSLSLFGAGSVNSRRIVSCPPDSGRVAGMRVKGVTPFLVDLGGGKNLLFVKGETEGGPPGG